MKQVTEDSVAVKLTKSVTLDDYADVPRWVAWRQEWRVNKAGIEYLTKIPHDPNNIRQAEIPTNPDTWGTRRQAESRWRQLRHRAIDGMGGTGIVLGALNVGDDLLMGLDLDHCIRTSDATNATITKWADDIIERFASYSEISPSARGVKVFFHVAAKDAAAVKQLMNGKTRIKFSPRKHREIAIDRARFYAVTKDMFEDSLGVLRTVSVDDIRWFINEAGPRYKQLYNRNGTSNTTTTTRDESGSGHGFRFMWARKAAGDTFEQACAAIRADTSKAGEWARRKEVRDLCLAWDNANANADAETRTLVRRRIDQFERRDIEWLWEPFVPLAMITLLCGDKAVGKSSVGLDIAARISKGQVWPRFGNDDEARASLGSVIILCKENDISRIIRPRLEAADADLSRIHTLGYEVPDDPDQIDPLERLDTTAKLLEQQIQDIGDVKLIMVDPITDYVGKIDMYRDNQVRALLNPLGRLASRYNLAFLNILHLNKKTDLSPRYRALGSVAFRNVSQSTMMVALDTDTPGRRFLAQDAANLCEETRSVSFTMQRVGAYHRVAWDDEWHDVDLDDIMADKRESKKEQAQALLREWLANGPVLVAKLQQKAKDAKISWRTIQDAKQAIRAVTRKPGKMSGKWSWMLPV